MAKITEFHPRMKNKRRIACCSHCRGHFEQQAAHRVICPNCFWWDVGLTAQALASRAFRELQGGVYR